MPEDANARRPGEMDTDYPTEEQEGWDDRTEHDRVTEVTGVGPYDEDDDAADGD